MGNEMAKQSPAAPNKKLISVNRNRIATGNDGVPVVRKTGSDNTNATANTSGTQEGGVPESAPKNATSRVASVRQEEQVSVNLPMIELMGYLQSVASNSSNLPMTRRDDPELGRIVSTLSTEEYAKKCEAFIPCDFRIIAGSFISYKKVWDLPTSEEYNPVDGVQEPGRSQGGACTNSLLKTLYDAENEPDDGDTVQYDANNLFKDDDDATVNTVVESLARHQLHGNFSFTMSTSLQMSWAQLLMKMKVEMENSGYFQVPMITSSRKLDLNKPFAIAPPDFDPAKNVKRALLIGCNYDSLEGAQIKASHDDVKSIQDYVVNIQGFSQSEDLMTVLIDDGEHLPPTYKNITNAFLRLSEVSQAGDVVFVHFSGHGCRVLDAPIDADVNSYDEAIVPCDFSTSGLLRDTLIFKTLIAPMKKGVTVTCVFDSCDTGVVVDLPYSWKATNVGKDGSAKMTINDDFSFVRFLKVIKTLYDSSTFTLLGKTVRGVLDSKSPTNIVNTRMYDEATVDASFDEGSFVTVGKENEQTNKVSSFFGVFSSCQSSKTFPNIKTTLTDISDLNTVEIPSTKPRTQSGGLFQQIFNCSLPILEDVDEGQSATQQTRNDDDSLGSVSFGTDMYSSAYESKSRRGGNSRSVSKRR